MNRQHMNLKLGTEIGTRDLVGSLRKRLEEFSTLQR